MGVEDGGKVLVRVPVTSVDAAVLVVELNSASDGLDEGEAGGLGLDSLELLPLVLGDVLGNKGVLGLDGGERSIDLGRHWLVLARVTSGEGLVFFHRVLTPSIIFWTSSTSEYPSLCLLEMSWVCPVWPPDSPRVPRGCRCSSSQRACSLSTLCLVQPGRS